MANAPDDRRILIINKNKIGELTDDEFIEIIKNNNSLKLVSENIGYIEANSYIHNIIIERIFSLNLETNHFLRKIVKSKLYEKTKECKNCGELIPSKNTYCNESCHREFLNKEKIKKWKETGDTGCDPVSSIRNCIRDYILEKQNHKCSVCGMKDIWNNKILKFVLDHIDGNASNNIEDNLRMVCPNCDSQLDTFKSKNKNSARKFRNNK